MSMWKDATLTALLMAAGFGAACYAAWREGRPISRHGRKALRAAPYLMLLMTVYNASFVLWPPQGYDLPGLQQRLAGDTVLTFAIAALAAVFSRIAPRIYAAGAAHHPAVVVPLSAQEIHLRRRHWSDAQKRAVPWYALGAGIAFLALFHGAKIHSGGWVIFSLLFIAVWMCVVAHVAQRQARARVRRSLAGAGEK